MAREQKSEKWMEQWRPREAVAGLFREDMDRVNDLSKASQLEGMKQIQTKDCDPRDHS